jgi:peroxiredoxin
MSAYLRQTPGPPRRFAASVRPLSMLALMLTALALRPVASPALQTGDMFTTFLGEAMDGSRIELAAMREERVVIIDFWATWAPPSLRQHDHLRQALAGGAKDFAWISVSLDRDPDAARAHIDGIGSSAAIYVCDGLGFNSPWAQRFSVVMAPTLTIIGKEGAIRRSDNNVIESRAAVESMLNASLLPIDATGIQNLAILTGSDPSAGRPATAKVNEPMPDFSLQMLKRAKPVTPGDFEGKVLLVVVFATWDSGSVDFIERVHRELLSRHQLRGFEMICIAVNKDGDEVEKWYTAKNYRPPFFVTVQRTDEQWSVTAEDGAFPMGDKLPRSFLVGKNGYVRDIGQLTVERIKQVLVEDLNVPI